MSSDYGAALLAAFGRIRAAAEDVMDRHDAAGYDWSETTVTDLSVIAGTPEVRHAKFNQREEGAGVGADYLWWWLDPDGGECFGMLVQAKAMRRTGQGWQLDIRRGQGKQLSDLLRTSDQFDVAAAYGVYTGGQIGRGAALHNLHADPEDGAALEQCGRCRRMTISIIAALQVSLHEYSPEITTSTFMQSHVPLEDLADPGVNAGSVDDLNLRAIESEPLRSWLVDEQHGPREVAKKIFQGVAAMRRGMWSAATLVPMAVSSEAVFIEVPDDTGHWGVPYYRHMLRGLRTAPPDYVTAFLADEPLPAELTEAVDGLVIFQM